MTNRTSRCLPPYCRVMTCWTQADCGEVEIDDLASSKDFQEPFTSFFTMLFDGMMILTTFRFPSTE